jgi:hypothetical protein
VRYWRAAKRACRLEHLEPGLGWQPLITIW